MLFMMQRTVDSVLTREKHLCLLLVHCSICHLLKQVCHGSQMHLHHFGSTMTHRWWFPDNHLGLIENLWCGSTRLCLPYWYYSIHWRWIFSSQREWWEIERVVFIQILNLGLKKIWFDLVRSRIYLNLDVVDLVRFDVINNRTYSARVVGYI